MFRNFFVFGLIVVSSFATAVAQDTEAKKAKEKAAQAFSWTFEGDGGYLGVQTSEVTKENFSKFGLAGVRGVVVDKVMENSPAQSAGLQTGDVIVRVDGEEITSVRKLTRLISEIAPDHQVKLVISRGGNEQELNATLGKRPAPKFENGNFAFPVPGPTGKIEIPDLKDLRQLKELQQMKEFRMGELPNVLVSPDTEGKVFTWRAGSGRQIGVGITPLTKQLAEHFGVDGGVMITSVRQGSRAFKAGLKAGDIIVEADGKAVKGDFDLIRTINDKKDGDVQLTIVRDRNRQTISVTPEVSRDAGFLFETDGEDGLTPPPSPGKIKITKPVAPTAPTAAPAPMTLLRPGRVV